MEIPEPFSYGFTVYSKSNCSYCLSVKNLLKKNNLFYTEINCDKFIIENKQSFLDFIEKRAETSYKTFPMVFYDKKFVGGFSHTTEFVKKLLLSFDNIF